MREANSKVEGHIIGVVEPRENAKIGYMGQVNYSADGRPQEECGGALSMAITRLYGILMEETYNCAIQGVRDY